MKYFEQEIIIDYKSLEIEEPKNKPVLSSYIIEAEENVYLSRKRPAIIFCPGGGYQDIAYHEGEPMALLFSAAGYQSFVFKYSVTPVLFPGALMELSMAVSYVRQHAKEYNIDPNRIYVGGFSAGGHLTASLGVYWKNPFIQRPLFIDNDDNRPNGLLLGYPVITGKTKSTHSVSMQNLLGKYPSSEEIELFSLEDNVNNFTPPTFLWHTADDEVVDVTNSLKFAQALHEYEIPFEMHVYPKGTHGLGLANEVTAGYLGQIVPACQNWIDMAIRFFNQL